MVAGRVKDAKDDDGIVFDAEETFIGKSLHQQAAEAPVVDGKSFGNFLKAGHGISDGKKKFIAQAGPLPVIPIPGRAKVGSGDGADGNATFHRVLEPRT